MIKYLKSMAFTRGFRVNADLRTVKSMAIFRFCFAAKLFQKPMPVYSQNALTSSTALMHDYSHE